MGSASDDCLFCRIVEGRVPSRPVRSTESSYAFYDVSPVAPTHVLVVPRQHISDAGDIDESHAQVLADMFVTAREVAAKESLTGGYRLVMNVGDDSGNTISHLHLHVLGGRRLGWPPG